MDSDSGPLDTSFFCWWWIVRSNLTPLCLFIFLLSRHQTPTCDNALRSFSLQRRNAASFNPPLCLAAAPLLQRWLGFWQDHSANPPMQCSQARPPQGSHGIQPQRGPAPPCLMAAYRPATSVLSVCFLFALSGFYLACPRRLIRWNARFFLPIHPRPPAAAARAPPEAAVSSLVESLGIEPPSSTVARPCLAACPQRIFTLAREPGPCATKPSSLPLGSVPGCGF